MCTETEDTNDNHQPVFRLDSQYYINKCTEMRSSPELEIELELINLELEFKLATEKLNPQINLPFNLLIQKYFFHDNPTWEYKLFGVGIQSRYTEQVFGVPTHGKKQQVKKSMELINLMWN